MKRLTSSRVLLAGAKPKNYPQSIEVWIFLPSLRRKLSRIEGFRFRKADKEWDPKYWRRATLVLDKTK